MKKKLVTGALLLAFGAVAVTGGTLAYFTDTAEDTNTIVVGNVDIELYESKYHRGATGNSYLKMTGQPEPLDDATIVADAATYHDVYLPSATLMPFDLKKEHRVQSMFEECTVAKNAYVQNTSKTNDCYVMVRYLVPENIAQYLDIFYTDTQFINVADIDSEKYKNIVEVDARTLDNTDKSEPIITYVNSGGTNFVEQVGDYIEEGYYVAEFIYAERLTPGEFTLYSPISKITMVPTVTNEIAAQITNDDSQFEIKVEAVAIQADGFYNAMEAFDAYWDQEAANQPQA